MYELCALVGNTLGLVVFTCPICKLQYNGREFSLVIDGVNNENFWHWQDMRTFETSESFYCKSSKTVDNAISTLQQLIDGYSYEDTLTGRRKK